LGDTTVKARRIAFEIPADLPRHYMADENLLWGHIIAVLSALFPAGEDFFVRSVRNVRDEITDPDLKRQVAGFIGQEATHGNHHREFNERLAQLGYPTDTIDRLLEQDAQRATEHLPKKVQLAVTSAFEHYTALLAEVLLSDPDARALFDDDEVRSLFLWHAVEESEHKSVAFDVYKALGGTEAMRIVTMQVVTAAFIPAVVAWTTISVRRDPARRDRRRWWASLRSVGRSPFISMRVLRGLLAYSVPGFHPSDRDNTELLAEWREQLFGDGGRLTTKLLGTAA
jgi:predicted metal-dependent hydrolase